MLSFTKLPKDHLKCGCNQEDPWIGHYLEGHLMACLPHVKIMVSRLSTILNHKFIELVAILGH
jgi:hypothetical protein